MDPMAAMVDSSKASPSGTSNRLSGKLGVDPLGAQALYMNVLVDEFRLDAWWAALNNLFPDQIEHDGKRLRKSAFSQISPRDGSFEMLVEYQPSGWFGEWMKLSLSDALALSTDRK
jgi:hypothetical protein